MTERTESVKTITIVVAMVIIIGLFTLVMTDRQGAGSLSIKLGDSEVTLDFADEKLNFHALINRLLTDETSAKETLSILRDTHSLFRIDDEFLVDRIRREPGDSRLSIRLRELLADLRGPFERNRHSFYDVTRVEVVGAINNLEYEHAVQKELRELRDRKQGLFQPVPIQVDVLIARPETAFDASAAICEGSKFKGRDLLLWNPADQSKTITVSAELPFPCVYSRREPDSNRLMIQINYSDAIRLFGPSVAATQRVAWMFPAPCGKTIAPRIAGVADNDPFQRLEIEQ